jgi:hypothetical protein
VNAADVAARLDRVTRTHKGFTARCPAHDDKNPSLSLCDGDDGRVLLHCHAGCSFEAIVEAIGLEAKDLAPDANDAEQRRVIATYAYTGEDGTVLFEVLRYVPKGFRQRRSDGAGAWIWNTRGLPSVVYRLPEVRRAIEEGQTVYVAEGEKDVDRLVDDGVTATCNPMGAGKWRSAHTQQLAGAREVVIIADNDKAGYEHARAVEWHLNGSVGSVVVKHSPFANDAYAHIELGHSIDEFEVLGDNEQFDDAEKSEPPTPGFPPLNEDALHGIFGDFVRTYAPHTEADPVALLVDSLTCFGNAVGLRPHFYVGSTRHTPRLFVVLAGDTAKARKGTSHHDTRDVFRQADCDWCLECEIGGLSTGEGLIAHVADVYAFDRETGEMKLVHEKDARCLIVEPEFGRLLTAAARDGATLSMVLRQAWDGGDLKVTTRKDPLVAKGRHISMIGHVTMGELALKLGDSDVTNGMANRVLFFAVHRPHLLPGGGDLSMEQRQRIGTAFKEALLVARGVDRMSWSPEAKAAYEQCYRYIESRTTGDAIDAVTARSSAYLIRLSMVYALGDGSKIITIEHLRAAWAVLRCADATAFRLFRGRHGNKTADQLLRLLREHPEGMSRTELDRAFSGHVDRLMIDELRSQGLVREEVVGGTGGRPRRMTFLVDRPDTAQPLPAFPAFSAEGERSGFDEE